MEATYAGLKQVERGSVDAQVRESLKSNRYEAQNGILRFETPEINSFTSQILDWTKYFQSPATSAGLPPRFIEDPTELRQLTAFFAWTAWASVAQRPGTLHSYTNNFPYEPMAGNSPTGNAVLWSALSLITLLGGVGIVLFAFGKFSFLGWKGHNTHVHPQMLPGISTSSQRATAKYFVVVVLLFLAQVLVGGMTAHYRADSSGFYGFDLSWLLPSNLARTWHLQLAIFWIATAYVAGGILLAPEIGGTEVRGQTTGVNLLFWALVLVVAGSMFGEMLGINRMLGNLWSWLGHQGWEYLDLGRVWQILLAIGLVFWIFLLFRAVAPRRSDPKHRDVASLFMYAAIAIPLFYLPAFFFSSTYKFLHRGYLAILDHSFVGGRIFRAFRYRNGRDHFLLSRCDLSADRGTRCLSRRHSLSGQRYRRDRTSLVLDGPVRNHHGAGCGVLRNGSGALDAVDT